MGGAIGPWFGGVIHDLTGSYRVAFLITIVFCALGAASSRSRVRRANPEVGWAPAIE